MTVFSAIASLLTLLVLVGVLWPLWHSSRRLFIGAVATLGIGALALYRLLGTPAAIEMPATMPAAAAPASLDEAVKQLEAELKRNPNEPEGWRLLGRSYLSLERYTEARTAFETALKLAPDDANLLVENAQARLYAAPDKQLDAQAVGLLQRALAIEPQHQRARWFLGVSQRQQGQPAEAARTWEPLLAQVDGGTAATLRTQINQARAEAGLEALPEPATPAPVAATGKPLLKVSVDIAPELKSRLAGGETLFVFARQAGGPPMPVAARRVPASSFPITLELGDGDSPMPTLKLSQVPKVELGARVSRAGDVMAKAGDLEAVMVPAEVGSAQAYSLRIQRVVE
nr:tetratricopeptide repeat protein [Pseudoxanthomonas sp.]